MIAAGWSQGSPYAFALAADGSVQRCLSQAMTDARLPIGEWLGSGLGQLLDAGGYAGIVDFNDAPGRTQQEVLDLLDEAIANYEDAGADL